MDDSTKDLVSQAQALYAQGLTPERTQQIRQLLERLVAASGGSDDGGPHAAVRGAGGDRRSLAEGLSLLADVLVCEYLNRWNGAGLSHVNEAKKHVNRALEMASNLPLAHYAKGFIHRANGEHDLALAAFEKTLEHNPKFARAHAQKGAELLYLGRPNEALPCIEKAIEMTPSNPSRGMFYWIGGRTRFFLGQYSDAIPLLLESIKIRDNLWYNRLYLVSAYALTGDRKGAKRTLQRFHALFSGYGTVAHVVEAEKTNPNDNLFVVVGRRNFHQGLRLAGMS
jgi:adenylate cyclase